MAEAHYLSMIVMGIGSFLFGMLPMGFSLRTVGSHNLFLSLVLCLGAGVLLATSLVHMLTEVQTKLKLSAQLYFCSGFLILYSFDEIFHYLLGNKNPEVHCNIANETCQKRTNCDSTQNSGSLSESSRLLDSDDLSRKFANAKNLSTLKHDDCHSPFRCENVDNEAIPQQGFSNLQQHQNRCHVDIGEPCLSNPVAKTGLLIALLIHSILEGVSIGVQTETSQILIILGAISFHKIVLSFCLGVELLSYGYKHLKFLISIFLFSIGSPIGIYIGMSVTSSSGIFDVDAQLQAVAAGSLLYVAAFEVLPRERFKWQHRVNHRAAGVFQLFFLLLGFICITTLHFFLGMGRISIKY